MCFFFFWCQSILVFLEKPGKVSKCIVEVNMKIEINLEY